MSKKKIIYLFGIGLICLVALYIYIHQEKQYPVDSAKTVYINKTGDKYQLIRNGKSFYIKGASGKSYIKELAEAGGNTLRLYDTINLQNNLDEAQKYNIAVIVDIILPLFKENSNIYIEEKNNEEVYLKIKTVVNKYKDHPALLIWNLGNEINYPLPLTRKSRRFIKVYNKMIDLIHLEDPNHPVGTSLAGVSRKFFSINRNSPQLDLIGINCFSSIKNVKQRVKIISYFTSIMPYYFSEWGINGPWEENKNKWMTILEYSSTQKGEIYKNIYSTYVKQDDQSIGSLAFYWGFKYEGTPTWFNVFDSEGRKSETYYSLKKVWSNNYSHNDTLPPKIKEMKLDGKIDYNLVFRPNQMIEAEIQIGNETNDKLDFKWEIYEDGWGKKRWKFNKNLDVFQAYNKISKKNGVRFASPFKDGAYRISVNIYDEYGNFATSNMPFYVLNL